MKTITRNVVEEAFGHPDWDSVVEAERSCHRNKPGHLAELRETAEYYRVQCAPAYDWLDGDARTTLTLPADDQLGGKWVDFLVHRLRRFGLRRQFKINLPQEDGDQQHV